MTKTQWAELCGKQQWDVLVSLRGPDCRHSENIKWFTTAVIRWAMHTVMRVGGTLNPDLKMIVVSSTPDVSVYGAGISSVMRWDPVHFFNHVYTAAQVLEIPVYTIPSGIYMLAVAEPSHPHLAVLKMYEGLSKLPHSPYLALVKELERHLRTRFEVDPNKQPPIEETPTCPSPTSPPPK